MGYSIGVLSQNHKIDSLKSLLPTLPSNASKAGILIDLTKALVEIDIRESWKFSTEALDIAKVNADTFEIVRAGRINAQILRRLGHLDSAVSQLIWVLSIAKKKNFRAG